MLRAKYRAKSALDEEVMDMRGIPHEGEWVYGYLVGDYMLGEIVEGGEEYIQPEWWVSIQPGTRGQFTGEQDSNGVDIYQGDIVEYESVYEWEEDRIKRDNVIFQHGQFMLPGVIVDLSLCTVVGNKHDDK